jgi:hypothetical protein
VVIAGALPAPAGAVNVATGFDAGAEAWYSGNRAGHAAGTVDYHPTGGNPGGYISGSDDESSESLRWDFVAPDFSAWTGDLSANYGGTLSYDVRHTAAANRNSVATFYNFDGGGMELLGELGPPPSGTGWNHYAFTLSESAPGWQFIGFSPAVQRPATAGDFAAVLSNVGLVQVTGDFSFGVGQITDVDNVCLIEPGQTCPAATTPPPGGGGGGGDNAACDDAKAKLKKAKAKLKKLKQQHASKAKIKKAKKKVKKAKQAVEDAC